MVSALFPGQEVKGSQVLYRLVLSVHALNSHAIIQLNGIFVRFTSLSAADALQRHRR
jgi:hypothetical protein